MSAASSGLDDRRDLGRPNARARVVGVAHLVMDHVIHQRRHVGHVDAHVVVDLGERGVIVLETIDGELDGASRVVLRARGA